MKMLIYKDGGLLMRMMTGFDQFWQLWLGGAGCNLPLISNEIANLKSQNLENLVILVI